jgi:DNA-binding NarL/FixJ family response regulator
MRVVLVEDQALLRDALVTALTARGIDIVGQARDETSAMDAVAAFGPDVVVLDIRLPPTLTDEGIRIAERIRRERPAVGLLLLSSFGEVLLAERLLKMPGGARSVGYLVKDAVSNLDQVVDTMRRVADGEVVIDPLIIDRLMAARTDESPLCRLTTHERRVLALVAEGRSNAGIARLLGCRTSTVEKHMSIITDKLGLPGTGDPNRSDMNVRVLAALMFLQNAP